MPTALRSRIVGVEKIPGRKDAWLDIVCDDHERNQLRITLLDAPGFIESAKDTPVELTSEFILCGGRKWAKRLSYCKARLCRP